MNLYENPEKLFKVAKLFEPESPVFSDWVSNEHTINLKDFEANSIEFVLRMVYEKTAQNIDLDKDMCFFDLILLCSYLFLDEQFLLLKMFPHGSFRKHWKKAITLIYKLNYIGYPRIAEEFLHFLHVPTIFLHKAKSSRKFLKSIKSARNLEIYFTRHILPFCRCDICHSFRHNKLIESIMVFEDPPIVSRFIPCTNPCLNTIVNGGLMWP